MASSFPPNPGSLEPDLSFAHTSPPNLLSSLHVNAASLICEWCSKQCRSTSGLTKHMKSCKNRQHVDISSNPSSVDASIDKKNLKGQFQEVYELVVSWRRNIFELPKGKQGKRYVAEMTSWIDKWCDNSEGSDFAFYAFSVMPHLLLQKTNLKMPGKEKKQILERRMNLWDQGDIIGLLREGKTLQTRLKQPSKPKQDMSDLARRFRNLMVRGNVSAALRLLESEGNSGGLLPNDVTTLHLLQEKHPQAEPLYDQLLLNGPIDSVEPVIFDCITPDLIRKLILKTKGAAGPSLLNADEWRRIAGSKIFGSEGIDLCKSISRLTKILCTQKIADTESLIPLIACRLIPLDKNPGLRPIGIGEVLRRIMGKAVTFALKREMQDSAGSLQLCVGLESGAEAGIHAMRCIFEEDNTHGIVQVDARNAFNTINRQVLLRNISVICPELAVYVTNCYTIPARLFVTGGIEISSAEGTTQGDPVAMPLYALGILPLLTSIAGFVLESNLHVKQVAFADDLAGAGTLEALKIWWDAIVELGPYIGYNAEPSKSWLIVKPEFLQSAETIFTGSGLKITAEGRKHLGAVLGSENFREIFVNEKIDEWICALNTLSSIALIEPHVAYSAFVFGFKNKFNYLMRTIPNISHLLKRLDDVIIKVFVKNLFAGHEVTDTEMELFKLPVKCGGLGICLPSQISEFEYQNSCCVTEGLVSNVVKQSEILNLDIDALKAKKSDIKRKKRVLVEENLERCRQNLSPEKLKVLEAVCEIGASSWLTTLPIKKYGFYLEKQSFRDAIFLRYGIPLKRLPNHCVCGVNFTEAHAFSCSRGGFTIMRHNEIRDVTGELLAEVCNDVKLEPELTPLNGESFQHRTTKTDDGARCDLSARGFWERGQKAFTDVRIFNPLAKCYVKQKLQAVHRSNEMAKKREYNERILHVEHGTFTPLVFSCYGGMSIETQRFYKHLN